MYNVYAKCGIMALADASFFFAATSFTHIASTFRKNLYSAVVVKVVTRAQHDTIKSL